ncbi:MAG: ATP synthase F1 subunit delta [Dehalococcoidia bacterium]|nr:ATP synthase F1 subunit delta [Dehalococcoidia bacterium]
MTVSVHARRYAKTLFQMARETRELSRWQSDIRKIDRLLEDKALCALMENPQVKWEEKSAVLTQRLADGNPTLLKLVALLVARGRLSLIAEIAEEFQRLVDNYRGIEGTETAEVVTAIPLDNDYQLKLAQRITQLIGKPVVLKTKVDPAIIGGIIIHVGDKLIDGSIRSKLAAMRKELGRIKL